VVLLFPLPVYADTITVDTLTDESDGSCVVGDCSLRDAIAVAQAGDTIVFSVTGTITLTLGELTVDKNLTITGPGASSLTVSGNDAFRVFEIGWGVNATISGLTIRDGQAKDVNGGGGILKQGGALTVSNCTFLDNKADVYGGAVYARDAVVTMTNNLLQENTGRYGGGAAFYQSTAQVTGNTFQNNEAETSGGGLLAGKGDLTLEQNRFLNNTAGNHGGGLYAEVETGHTHTMTNNLFQGNVADPNGSGTGGGARLFGQAGGQLTFSHNQVLENFAATGPTGANGGRGGGLFVLGPALLSDNLFQGNWASSASPQGGYYYGGYGGGLYLMGSGLQIEGNHILENRAARNAGINYTAEAFGGGAYLAPMAVATMTNNIIAGNRYCQECTVLSGSYRGGGAVSIGGQTSPAQTHLYLYHNTIADNQSPALFNESAAITMSHSILSGHDLDLRTILDSSGGSQTPPTVAADYTLWWPALKADILSGDFSHLHDLTGTPDFVSTAADDYHLGSNSEAIDQGPGIGVTTDIDGNSRPLQTGYDLGADEYTGVDLSPSTKQATPLQAAAGQVVTYTISLRNSGSQNAPAVTLFDAIPGHTAYVPHSALASAGTITGSASEITWRGDIPSGETIAITFQVTVTDELLIQNTALVTDIYGTNYHLTALVNGNDSAIYLPLLLRHSP
jgi:uncharacterized repeat protein (TIGR01451 family)/CSLREA domain-containing protein